MSARPCRQCKANLRYFLTLYVNAGRWSEQATSAGEDFITHLLARERNALQGERCCRLRLATLRLCAALQTNSSKHQITTKENSNDHRPNH